MLDLNRDFLLLDGDCGLCHRLAFFMDSRLANDADIAYRPIKSNDAQKLIQAFPLWQKELDTVYLIRNGLPLRGQRTKNNSRTRKGKRKTVANKKKATK